MKKLLLFAIILFSYPVNAAHVQITFVEGFSINVITNNDMYTSAGSETTDAAINLIFANYAVVHCVNAFAYPNSYIFAVYYGTNLDGFISDLKKNNNVLNAQITLDENDGSFSYADRLGLQLLNGTNGNPLSINDNGNITTTNDELNLIFENYKVYNMEEYIPNSKYHYYTIKFNGEIAGIFNALNNLINVVSNVGTESVVMLLSNNEFQSKIINISPNPFSEKFQIQTDDNITNYLLFDIRGKQIISTTSKSELDNKSTQLTTGMYILNIQFEGGQKSHYKLVKK